MRTKIVLTQLRQPVHSDGVPEVMRAGVQADDLTGACDTAATFAGRGLQTVVLLPEAAAVSFVPEILVLDTESRGLPVAEARSRARLALARLAAHRPQVLYKKVDSTLRGAVAAELRGALEGAGLTHTVLAPAFPAQRRVVADGVLLVDGRPAHETAIARDPGFPRTGASILALLGAEGSTPVGHVPLSTVRRAPPALAARLRRWADSGGTLVCDAETDADLGLVAAATVTGSALLSGSAGFAATLATHMGADRQPPRQSLRRPLCVVAGSTHPATQAQLARLEARGLRAIWLGSAEAPDGGASPACAERGSADDSFLAVRAEPGTGDATRRDAMARRLASTARRHLEHARRHERPLETIVVTGGDTAVAFCRAVEATGLCLLGEVERGLALGRLLDGPFAHLTLVTKAGGFGDPETLVRVWTASS
jgi:uncharacterized protein YgbK (DUF1537 family)